MFETQFEDINKAAIDRLIENQVYEDRTLEYKQELPGQGSDARKNFCAEVVAFANTLGGHIFFGIEEEVENGVNTGKPRKATGVAIDNLEVTKRRLEQIILSNIAPRLNPHIRIKEIEDDEYTVGPVLVLKVPKSWSAPHMVTVRGSPFYLRGGTHKEPMDVIQIRDAFLGAEELPTRIRGFRESRIEKLLNNETPVPLSSGSILVLHVLPLSAFSGAADPDFETLFTQSTAVIGGDFVGSSDRRINIDGILRNSISGRGRSDNYAQFYRNGIIEGLSVNDDIIIDGNPQRTLVGGLGNMVPALEKYFDFLVGVGVPPPYYVFATLLNVSGKLPAQPPSFRGGISNGFDRDSIIIPEIVISELPCDVEEKFRPALDMIYQAAGYRKYGN